MPESREKATARMRQWRADNPEAASRAKGRWRTTNPAGYLMAKTCNRAKLKGLAHDLTLDWLNAKLDAGKCEVTGLPFVHKTGSPWAPSVDRKDSNRGYEQDNCRVVVWMFNVAKSVWTDDDVRILAEAITR